MEDLWKEKRERIRKEREKKHTEPTRQGRQKVRAGTEGQSTTPSLLPRLSLSREKNKSVNKIIESQKSSSKPRPLCYKRSGE